ncbi:MAG: hypothetical protein WC427_01450 [Candidatus Paceibacterota bacterium]|jgi:hypothetical protein
MPIIIAYNFCVFMKEGLVKLTNALYKVTGLFPAKEPLKFAIRKEALDVLFFYIVSEKQTTSSQRLQKESSLKKSLECLGLLKTYFEIAKQQKWVDARNFLVMEKEYLFIEEVLAHDLSKITNIHQQEEQAKAVEESLKKEIIQELKDQVKIELNSLPKQETKKQEGLNHLEQLGQAKEQKSQTFDLEKPSGEIDYEKLTSIQLKLLELLQGNGQLRPNEINKHFPNLTSRSIRRELKGLKERRIIGTIGTGRSVSYKINLEI